MASHVCLYLKYSALANMMTTSWRAMINLPYLSIHSMRELELGVEDDEEERKESVEDKTPPVKDEIHGRIWSHSKTDVGS